MIIFASSLRQKAMFDLMKLNNISKNMLSRLTGEEVYERTLAWAKEYNESFAKMLEEYKDYAIKVLVLTKIQIDQEKI